MLHINNRPKTFDEVKGNRNLIRSLKSLLKRKDRPHSYLFQGPSGCGKTTMARIMAGELGCSGMDLKELNCADFRGIDSAREIIQQMRLAPMSSHTRCWIIDESAKLTNEAQHALLKALEEPPNHVYFFLCTTHPEKMLPTIRSRCTPCEVKPLCEEDLVELQRDMGLEGVPNKIYQLIARKSGGQPRFALVQLDKIKDLPPKTMVKEIKSFEQEKELSIKLCRLLLQGGSWQKASILLKGLSDEDPESVRGHVLGYCSAAMLNGNEKAAAVMGYFLEPFYDSGKHGLYLAIYDALKGE